MIFFPRLGLRTLDEEAIALRGSSIMDLEGFSQFEYTQVWLPGDIAWRGGLNRKSLPPSREHVDCSSRSPSMYSSSAPPLHQTILT